MKTLIGALVFFNLFDGIATLFILSNRYGVELNPIMAALYSWDPIAFVGFKTIATFFMASLLWMNKDVDSARNWGVVITAIYGTLFCYQVSSLVYLRVMGYV